MHHKNEIDIFKKRNMYKNTTERSFFIQESRN